MLAPRGGSSPPPAGVPLPPPPAAHPTAYHLTAFCMRSYIACMVPDPVVLAPQTSHAILHLLSASVSRLEPPTTTCTDTSLLDALQVCTNRELMLSHRPTRCRWRWTPPWTRSSRTSSLRSTTASKDVPGHRQDLPAPILVRNGCPGVAQVVALVPLGGEGA